MRGFQGRIIIQELKRLETEIAELREEIAALREDFEDLGAGVWATRVTGGIGTDPPLTISVDMHDWESVLVWAEGNSGTESLPESS
jgi:hypothetical protein